MPIIIDNGKYDNGDGIINYLRLISQPDVSDETINRAHHLMYNYWTETGSVIENGFPEKQLFVLFEQDYMKENGDPVFKHMALAYRDEEGNLWVYQSGGKKKFDGEFKVSKQSYEESIENWSHYATLDDLTPEEVKVVIDRAEELIEKDTLYPNDPNNPKSNELDCSGFVRLVLSLLGYDLTSDVNSIYSNGLEDANYYSLTDAYDGNDNIDEKDRKNVDTMAARDVWISKWLLRGLSDEDGIGILESFGIPSVVVNDIYKTAYTNTLKLLQAALGFNEDDITGALDDKTWNAVVDWYLTELKYDIEATDDVQISGDESTHESAEVLADEAETHLFLGNEKISSLFKEQPSFKIGDEGDDVKHLQYLLTLIDPDNFGDLICDGILGPNTLTAINQYQSLRGLQVTSYVDTETYGALEADYNVYKDQIENGIDETDESEQEIEIVITKNHEDTGVTKDTSTTIVDFSHSATNKLNSSPYSSLLYLVQKMIDHSFSSIGNLRIYPSTVGVTRVANTNKSKGAAVQESSEQNTKRPSISNYVNDIKKRSRFVLADMTKGYVKRS